MTISQTIASVCLMLLLVTTVFDIYWTSRGIKAGVGVEGFNWIVALTGTDKPSWLGLLWTNALFSIPSLGFLSHNPALFGFAVGHSLMYSYLHFRGMMDWQNLLFGK